MIDLNIFIYIFVADIFLTLFNIACPNSIPKSVLVAEVREATNKILFLVAQPLREGGVKARPLRKKDFFYIFIYFSPKIVEKIFFCKNPFPAILRRKKHTKKVPMVTKPREGGG